MERGREGREGVKGPSYTLVLARNLNLKVYAFICRSKAAHIFSLLIINFAYLWNFAVSPRYALAEVLQLPINLV